MKTIFFAMAFAAAGVLTTSAATPAHHGGASLDEGTVLTLEGTVAEWIWAFPHNYLTIDVEDENGAVTRWVLETQNPVSATRLGFRRGSFAAGDEVTVNLTPVKSGAPLGLIRSVVLPDGERLGSGGDAPAPTQAK
jgi:hypothetical protein